MHGEGFSHESRVTSFEERSAEPEALSSDPGFCLSQLVTRISIPFPRQGRLANQLSLSTSQTPASIMMATDPTGTKTRLYSAVSRAR